MPTTKTVGTPFTKAPAIQSATDGGNGRVGFDKFRFVEVFNASAIVQIQ